MKQCRFCDNWIPFYGQDTCSACEVELCEIHVVKYPEPEDDDDRSYDSFVDMQCEDKTK